MRKEELGPLGGWLKMESLSVGGEKKVGSGRTRKRGNGSLWARVQYNVSKKGGENGVKKQPMRRKAKGKREKVLVPRVGSRPKKRGGKQNRSSSPEYPEW